MRTGSAEGQADDVHVVVLKCAFHGRTPAAPHVQQRHTGFQVQFSEREIDLGLLGLFQREGLWLEIRAAVRPAGVEEQCEEVIGQVVVGLYVRELWSQF